MDENSLKEVISESLTMAQTLQSAIHVARISKILQARQTFTAALGLLIVTTLNEPVINALVISLAKRLVELLVEFLAFFRTVKSLLTEARNKDEFTLLIPQLLLLLEDVGATIVAVGDMS